MIDISKEKQLDDLKTAHDVLLVYFSPPTCSVGESLVDKVEVALEGRPIGAARVDTSASPAISGQLLVLAFPTIIIFVYGKEFARLSRIISMGDVEHALDRALVAISD